VERAVIRFALVFLAVALADVCWTLYFQKVATKAAHASAFWSAAIVALGAFTITEYTQSRWLILAAVLGAYAGTWATVRAPVTWLWGSKDGGPESRVRMWGLECKAVGSILVLRFEEGTREAFHTHAFNAWSWVLSGALVEQTLPEKNQPLWHDLLSNMDERGLSQFTEWAGFGPSLRPIHTDRRRFHKVAGGSRGAWVLSFRGPWWTGWRELDPTTGEQTKLAPGRQERE
jgi:hypothetical protein